MISALAKDAPNAGSRETSGGLVACQCPACKLLFWHDHYGKEEMPCPFCTGALPNYLTRVVPQALAVCGDQPQLISFSEKNLTDGPSAESNGFSPFEQEFFMVQGIGFRCMAYRNGDGKWRGAFDDEELPGAIRVLG